MTVFPAPSGYEQPNISGVSQNMIREASRSGSRKRYPFMDSEPFQGNHPPDRNMRSRSSKERRYSQGDHMAASFANRRVPQHLTYVESTLKNQIAKDRQQYMDRMQ